LNSPTNARKQVEAYWYLILIPIFAVLSVIEFYPLLYSFWLSFTTTSGGVTLGNYWGMLVDGNFWNSVIVSLVFATLSTLMAVGVGLGLSFLVTQEFRGRSWFEGMFILPLALAPIAVGILWGPAAFWDDLQSFLHFDLGLPFLGAYELSILFYFPNMIASEAYEWAPLIMLVSLSIISSTPKEIYEAARLHGASGWQVFTKLMAPAVLNSPVMQFVLVLRFIDAMNSFAIPLDWSTWVGFSTSVGTPVDTLSLFLYKLLFIPSFDFPLHLVSAIAVALLAVTLASVTVMMRLLSRVGR
jgi:multiple sugar transport system permease protein